MAENNAPSLPVSEELNVPVPMRDGVVLRADVYRPSGKGRWPVLLLRTPYDKTRDGTISDARKLASQGYVVVTQDTRGRFASDGDTTLMFLNAEKTGEGPDGYDTVEWAAALPNSDGRVGTYGNSYMGYTSWLAAIAQPPSLKAMYSSGMSATMHQMTFGVFDIGRRQQWMYAHAADNKRRAGEPGGVTRSEADHIWERVERQKWLWFLPQDELPYHVFSTLTPQARQHYREQHLNAWDFSKVHSQVTVPTCQSTGWYDRLNGTIANFEGMVANGPADTRGQHRIVVGPWGHSTEKLTAQQGVENFGPEADSSYPELVGRWFDWQFKGADNGLADEPPVRIFVMGPNLWRLEKEWPLARTQFTPYYLHSGGKANTERGDGSLSPEMPGCETPDGYTFDPRDPVMSLMGIESHLAPCDMSAHDGREDILVYQTPPLERAQEVTGPVVVKLWAATDAPDTDFTAKLVNVYPDGHAVNLCHGIARARYRKGMDQEVLMTPGEPAEITIKLLPTACVFGKGHRIRLDISSSDFPNWDRNHNTGRDWWSDPELRSAKQTILHDAQHPSHVVLPLIPAS